MNRDILFTMETTRLIERCRQGDEDALGELYKAYARRMKGICRRYISDEQAVNDVLHDAFVIIYTSFNKLRDDSKAESWIMSITRNVASKYKDYLDARPTVPIELTKETETVDIGNEEANVKGVPLSEVINLIDKLPSGYSRVFRLSVFEGLSHKEIASMLGIEPHSSSSQLARAKKMLRKMMRQYWALLLLLLFPATFLLLRKGDTAIMEEKPVATKQKEVLDSSQTEPLDQKPFVAEESLESERPQKVHLPARPTIIEADSLPNMIAQENEVPDTTAKDTTRAKHKAELPHYKIADLFSRKSELVTRRRQKWSLRIAYAGGYGEQDMRRPYSFTETPLTDVTSIAPQPVTFKKWSDYAAYLSELPDDGNSHTRSVIMNIALNNASQPGNDWIMRTSHHHMPVAWSIAMKYRVSNRFGIESGLSYSRLTSDFEMGADGNVIREQQAIHYLGIPVKGIYNIYNRKAWTLYGGLGPSMEIPVHSQLYTTYFVHGTLEASEKATFRAPWQWSVGTGVGVQYNLTPNIGLFAEPNLQYYIPTGSNVETYRTEHPFTFSLPLGIKFTW